MKSEKKISKPELFLKLAEPNEAGISRWVSVNEFVGEYSKLMFGNGLDWARKESAFAKKYIVEVERNVTPGTKVDLIRVNGFRTEPSSTQSIRQDIWKSIKQCRCVVLGTSNPEVDHKNGWKNDSAVESLSKQKLSDFQPLSKAANDAKRQFCKECRRSHRRYDAKRLGYPISYYAGNDTHDGSADGCIGCFWYDPIEFRRHLIGNE